ncbi:hypothetical protein R5W23_001849 [Gemmata sp. JC673]|uniref:Uncharacterized protein n=1 Tax=Gemmata algarum TaxID=2975278 RepID=A0ABU5EZD7_9BACT|nr:hypothetical protein [Gemmata algarum]MDY3560604.1 hypothetical protein [Gemmata algarum]
MTVAELAHELARRGVPASAYCLTGGLPNEAYTIGRVGDVWQVYYSERGCRTGLQEFAIEAAACRAFLRDITGASDAEPGAAPDTAVGLVTHR